MKIFFKCVLLFSVFVLAMMSCAGLSKKELAEIRNNSFTFQKFYFYQKNISKKDAFAVMKMFPIVKVNQIISHKYGINIDSSEYEQFISNGDPSAIIESGFLMLKTDYTWKSSANNQNGVEIECVVSPLTNRSIDNIQRIEYKIILIINGKDKILSTGQTYTGMPVLPELADGFDYKRVDKNSDDAYINTENKSIVYLTGSKQQPPTAAVLPASASERKLTNEEVKQQIKKYIDTLPKENRKKFRDDIIKYLYTVIE